MIYSPFASVTQVILGKTAKPLNLASNTFTASTAPEASGALLSWTKTSDIDIQEYVIQVSPNKGTCSVAAYTNPGDCISNGTCSIVEHTNPEDCASNLGTWSTSWSTSWEAPGSEVDNTEIFRGYGTEFLYTPTTFSTGTHYFMVKAMDTLGNYSTLPGYRPFSVVAPSWGSQNISYTIEAGFITLSWPEPVNAQFNIEGYEVRYRTSSGSTAWAGAITTGQGTTEGAYTSGTSISFPITWGPGVDGLGTADRTFLVKSKDTAGNISSNQLSVSVGISAPSTLSVSSQFISNTEGTKSDVRLWWVTPTVGTAQLPIDHYKVFYQDYKTGSAAPTFNSRGSEYLENLGTTEFKQEVTWGPSNTNSAGSISAITGTSNDIRRYWVVPVDTAGNWGVAYNAGEADYVPDIEDVVVVRPNSIVGITTSDFSTKSSNGVVDISWTLPTITTAPITSIRVFWELPAWDLGSQALTSTRGEKNSKSGAATKYSTPVTWGPSNGSSEASRTIYFVAYDSAGNVSVPTGVSIAVSNPAQISNSSLTTQVIDNNVIIRWTDPTNTSLPIASYDVYRCPATGTCSTADYLSTSNYITNVGSTNTYSFFETSAGSYKYFIRTKDLAGNYSVPQSTTAAVNEPRDFVLLNDVASKYTTGALQAAYCSGFVAGNEVDCEAGGGDWVEPSAATWANILGTSGTTAVLPVNTTETWAQHFTSNTWTTIQDHITATHDYYLIPENTATYWQKWDMGTLIPSSTIQILENAEDYSGVVTKTPVIYYTNNELVYEAADITSNTGWTAGTSGDNSLLASTFRYVKVHVDYVSTSNSIREIVSQKVTLGLGTKRDQSDTTESILWADRASGASVSFNKTFSDVNSISVTPKYIVGGNTNGNQNTAIYDFNDVANPTSFTVYLLDATNGSFADGSFTWQAIGV